MTASNPSRNLTAALSALAAAFGFLSASSLSAGITLPASDLTITVQELENGDVEFSASGTGYGKISSNFNQTPGDYSTGTPPHTLGDHYDSIEIPPGVVLTTEVVRRAPEYGPEEAPADYDLELNYLYFNSAGFWTVGDFPGYIETGDPITGSGSVVTSAVPFSHFVPGTHVVTSGPFDITYQVLPYVDSIATSTLAPALSIQKPRRFPTTTVGRSSRPQRIRVRNVGTAPVTGISVRTSGSEFAATQVARKTLAPGASAAFRATFRPKRGGLRRAVVSVRSNAPKASAGVSGRGAPVKQRSPLLFFR